MGSSYHAKPPHQMASDPARVRRKRRRRRIRKRSKTSCTLLIKTLLPHLVFNLFSSKEGTLKLADYCIVLPRIILVLKPSHWGEKISWVSKTISSCKR